MKYEKFSKVCNGFNVYECLNCDAAFSYPPKKIGEEDKNKPLYASEDKMECPFCHSTNIKTTGLR